jgi:hypothetical protein
MLTMLGGCATSTPVPIDDYCQLYAPIHDSAIDTDETRAQVLRENAKFECLCRRDCPS